MLNGIVKFSRVIIGAVLALILCRMGISYLAVLVALGFILSFISKNKWEGVLSAVIYTTLSYIISYPSGLYLKEFMPTIEIPIVVNPTSVIMTLFLGWLIPVIIAIIISGCAAILGKECAKIIRKDKKEDKEIKNDYQNDYQNSYQNDYQNDFEDNEETKEVFKEKSVMPKPKNRKNKEILEMSPIQKAKLRQRQRQNKDE